MIPIGCKIQIFLVLVKYKLDMDIVLMHSISSLQTNTFQCVLATDGYKSFVIFLYAHERIQWTTGDDDGGVGGLGGDGAVAGIYTFRRVRSITIPGSSTPQIINIDQNSNVGVPGMWIYKLGDGECLSLI